MGEGLHVMLRRARLAWADDGETDSDFALTAALEEVRVLHVALEAIVLARMNRRGKEERRAAHGGVTSEKVVEQEER